MSRIGYYRYKLDNLSTAQVTKNVTFYINNISVVTHSINISQFCEGEKLLKYLDTEGQYRFISFNKYWEGRNNPESIGVTSEIVKNILNAQSNEKALGYKNNKTLSLTKSDISADQLLVYQQILTSPRVYLQIGELDGLQDWLLVSVRPIDAVYKRRKLLGGNFSIEITLPENYSQKMI